MDTMGFNRNIMGCNGIKLDFLGNIWLMFDSS